MRYLMILLIVGVFLCQSVNALAGKGGHKGPSDSAYEHANEHASFKRDENWQPGDFGKKKDDGEEEHGEKEHKHKHKHDGHHGKKDGRKHEDADDSEDHEHTTDDIKNEVQE